MFNIIPFTSDLCEDKNNYGKSLKLGNTIADHILELMLHGRPNDFIDSSLVLTVAKYKNFLNDCNIHKNNIFMNYYKFILHNLICNTIDKNVNDNDYYQIEIYHYVDKSVISFKDYYEYDSSFDENHKLYIYNNEWYEKTYVNTLAIIEALFPSIIAAPFSEFTFMETLLNSTLKFIYIKNDARNINNIYYNYNNDQFIDNKSNLFSNANSIDDIISEINYFEGANKLIYKSCAMDGINDIIYANTSYL